MSIYPSDSTQIQKAAEVLHLGGVVAFPTETVYGLGADAFNALAVARIFEIKNRPHFDPLIVHIADFTDFERLAKANDLARKLAKMFWPGALTLVLNKKPGIPDLVVSGLSTVAVRMPSHPVALELIRAAKTPIAAPSANPFGYLSPTTARHVEEQLGGQVGVILDGGSCVTGVESTIVDLSGGVPRLLRPGGTPVEEIEKITGPLERVSCFAKPAAPGQLPQHYAPHKPLKILNFSKMQKSLDFAEAGVLLFSLNGILKSQSQIGAKAVEALSKSSDLKEAAANFFSALHRLDHSAAKIIFAEPMPEKGLGLAMMDRLRRAEATHF